MNKIKPQLAAAYTHPSVKGAELGQCVVCGTHDTTCGYFLTDPTVNENIDRVWLHVCNEHNKEYDGVVVPIYSESSDKVRYRYRASKKLAKWAYDLTQQY